MNLLQRTLATAVCLAAASACSAASVTVLFDNPIFNGSGYDNVHIQHQNSDGSGATTAYVSAGRFQGTVMQYEGVSPSIFVGGLNDLYMYCYDVYESIDSGWTVNYTIKLDGELARTLQFLGAVNKVLSGSGAYDPYAWLRPATANQGAAIQLGIWESKYDISADWSLTGGAFQAWDLESDTTTAWNSFISAIPTSTALDGKYAMTLEVSGAQDMITADPPSSVPEPGSLFLVGAALAGLAAVRRAKPR